MFYRKVYPQSWKIIKKDWSLLFFGLFASILGFHEVKIIFNLNETTPDFLGSTIINWMTIFFSFANASVSWISMSGLLTTLGLFIIMSVATIMAVSSQGTLTYSALNGKKGVKKLSLAKMLRIGVDKFWPLLVLNIINTLIGYFFVQLVIDPMIFFLANTQEWLLYFILAVVTFFVLIPIVVILSFITRYGSAYVVIKEQKFLTAFTNSWLLFKANWVITVENALFLTFLTSLFYVLLFSTLVFIFTPFLILATFMAFSSFAFWMIVAIGAILGILVLVLGTAFYGAYYNIVWAKTFLELSSPGQTQSKIHRLTKKHLSK